MPDLLIVGAGPAGLAAAIQAGELGLDTVVVDENTTAGGQFYRQYPESFQEPASPRDPQRERGRQVISRARRAAEFRLGASVWGIDGPDVWLDQGGEPDLVRSHCTLLATGAHDRPTPFPGWTLPGVITAGAAQTLVKGQAVKPGSRAVVAGSGPFLLTVAAHLVAAGVRVVEVVEAATLHEGLRLLPRTLPYPARYVELSRYLTPLLRHGARFTRGCVVAAAEGRDHVERVELEPLRGGPRRTRSVGVDLLCVGYGFSAPTDLARLAGCSLRWDTGMAQPVPRHDRWQATSVPGLLVAGEACGLGGASVSALEGQIAAIGAARQLARLSDPEAARLARPLWARLRRARGFARVLTDAFPHRLQLAELPTDDTIVCRCQNVRWGTVRKAVEEGAHDLNEVKTSTRCGMGWCQGRICGAALPDLITSRVDPGFDHSAVFTARPPFRPVRASTLARALPRR